MMITVTFRRMEPTESLKPTAVNPDFRLRAVARSYDWPVLHLG